MRVNLVLSGGMARGIAHIGVLKALGELGIEVKALSGVSAGAIVSVFHAVGYTPEEMVKILKNTRWLSIFRLKVPRRGLFSLKRAERELRKYIDYEYLEELPLKVHICATDFLEGKPVYFSEGELFPILLGSCALPGVFEPVKYKSYLLVDGGIVNNLPVEPFRKSKLKLIGVDVNPTNRVKRARGIVHILARSFLLAVRSNVDKRKEACDVVIVPDIAEFSPLDINKIDQLYELGYRKTIEEMGKFLNAFSKDSN